MKAKRKTYIRTELPWSDVVEIVRAMSPNDRSQRLGAPLRLTQAEWRIFGAPDSHGSLPAEIERELIVRWMILAMELDVDIADRDWLEKTSRRVTLRLLLGNGARVRRFPTWVLGGRRTYETRPLQDSGPLRVVRPSHRKRRFTTAQLDKAQKMMEAARKKDMHLTECLMPLAQQIGGGKAAPETAKALREAVRNRGRGRRAV